MINIDPSKIQMSTIYQVDKIPVYTTKDDGQGLTSHGTLAVPAVIGPAVGGSVFVAQVANPYKRKCLPTFSWSLDDVNYYPMNVPIFYFNPTFNEYLWQALGFAGCSDTTIYLGATTQYDVGPQTMYLQLALDSPT